MKWLGTSLGYQSHLIMANAVATDSRGILLAMDRGLIKEFAGHVGTATFLFLSLLAADLGIAYVVHALPERLPWLDSHGQVFLLFLTTAEFAILAMDVALLIALLGRLTWRTWKKTA